MVTSDMGEGKTFNHLSLNEQFTIKNGTRVRYQPFGTLWYKVPRYVKNGNFFNKCF